MPPATASRAPFERRYYTGISVVFLALVFWTFARTFYLQPFLGTPALSGLLRIHGAVMTGWVVLLVVQTSLIAAHRVRWHRRLGWVGVFWAGLVVIFGSVTTLAAAAREVRHHTAFAPSQVVITGLDLIQMVFFAVLVAAAVWLRKRPDYHKRLMLLTIVCMLPDALARLPVSFVTNPFILAGMYGFVVVCVGIDALRNRRLHPVFGWGGTIILGTFTIALYAMSRPAWIAFGSRMVG
jgi:magnesium-transporting ATPase (P-type)